MDSLQHHLSMILQNFRIPQDHEKYLLKLKASGFEPKVIYDIGCCVRHWTTLAESIWPNAKYILFDAFDKAEFLYQNYDYHLGVLGNENDKIVKFYQNDYCPTGNSYYKENNDSVFPEHIYKEYKMMTLDTIVAQRNFPLPDFIKIDVQGSEKDVLAGAIQTIKSSQHMIVEMQNVDYNRDAPKVFQTLPYIESLGFTCVAPLFCNNGPDGDYGFKNLI